jgi:hypothetical protein
MRGRVLGVVGGMGALACALATFPAHAADPPGRIDPEPPRTVVVPTIAAPPPPQYSVLVFGGRMSTTDIYSTAFWNLTRSDINKPYDNWIVGVAFQRDIWRWNKFVIGAEIGLADRFGHYERCCDVIVRSSNLVHSGELWGGLVLRHEGYLLFNTIQVGAGLIGGFSAVTKSIGREREREITQGGNAAFLFYLGAELTLSTPRAPNVELVSRLHHRSGGSETLGGMSEGYNVSVVGLRWRF